LVSCTQNGPATELKALLCPPGPLPRGGAVGHAPRLFAGRIPDGIRPTFVDAKPSP